MQSKKETAEVEIGEKEIEEMEQYKIRSTIQQLEKEKL